MTAFSSDLQKSPRAVLTLSGTIDERVDLVAATTEATGGELVLRLAGVDRINSNGVRLWVRWVESLEARGIRLLMEEVSPVLVAQLNSIRGFAGQRGVVVSVQAPFMCEACGSELTTTVDVRNLRNPPVVLAPRCQDCGGATAFDDLESAYFAFLDAQPTAGSSL